MSPIPARPLWRGRILAILGLILFAFSLRVGVASLSPVIDHVERDFPMPAAVVGLIGTAPPVCFAVFGIVTPLLERRLGLERLALSAVLVVTAGMVLRTVAGDSIGLLLSTIVVFAAVGVGNIILPPLVRAYFPDRVGLMTTAYSTTMAVATLLPPLVAVPVSDATNWRVSLGVWAVFAAASVIPWIGMLTRARRPAGEIDEPATPRVFGRMWRLPLAWSMMFTFLVSGVIAYTSFAWLPHILVDVAGVTPATAGALLSLFAAMGLPASLFVPLLVARFGAVRPLVAISVICGLIGSAGFLFAPSAAPWLWVALYGLAALLFPLVLVLLSLRARTREGAVALSSFTQSIGYAITAIFPFAFGVLREVTSSWTIPLIVIAVIIAGAVPSGLVIARPRTIEDDWERRHGAW